MTNLPKNKRAQQLIQSCRHAGIDRVVISPGSRNAPLIIGLKAADDMQLYSIVDERSAGFFALGMAQQLRKPVAVLCTSGSALLNYYPAVAEAYYSNIPLVIISADRPEHLIDIGDGQTIRQEGVLDKHVLGSLNFKSLQQSQDLEDLFELALESYGPVHVNVPFDEPLYDLVPKREDSEALVATRTQRTSNSDDTQLKSLASSWNKSSRKLVLVGEHFPDPELKKWLVEFSNDPSVLILIENTANVAHEKFINSIDKLIFPFDADELLDFQPDILLSLGGMIVSKKIKQHLRKYKPKQHWHVDQKRAFNTFHCLNAHILDTPNHFFNEFAKYVKPVQSNYQHFWLTKKAYRLARHADFLNQCEYSDLKVFNKILQALPEHTQLQLGNSSVIRYSQLFDIKASISVFCNRGTSGIDGSMSTAVGAAVVADKPTVFITGDISFFYDSNALWNSYIPKNFRVIMINNGGGGIFRFIPGPSDSGALEFFETPHQMNASHLCEMYGFSYSKVENEAELDTELPALLNGTDKPTLLEIFTPKLKNDLVLKAYFNYLKQ